MEVLLNDFFINKIKLIKTSLGVTDRDSLLTLGVAMGKWQKIDMVGKLIFTPRKSKEFKKIIPILKITMRKAIWDYQKT